jgi:hypothetical protein
MNDSDTPLHTGEPSSELPVLRLRRGEDRRLNAGHLWVFSNEVNTETSYQGRWRGC